MKNSILLLLFSFTISFNNFGQETITITPSVIRHDVNSYVIGTVRNHVKAEATAQLYTVICFLTMVT